MQRMGRRCRICGRNRPNEKFGGKGYAASVCRDCRQLPKTQQALILAQDEVQGFLEQTKITAKNIARLESLASIDDGKFQELRTLILEIAGVRPCKRKRWINLQLERPDLYRRVIAAGWFFNSDLDERLDSHEMPHCVKNDDWESLDVDEQREILAHGRLNARDDSQ